MGSEIKRGRRAETARQTLEILKTGYYVSPRLLRVNLAPALRQAVTATRLFEPGELEPLPAAPSFPTAIIVTAETTLAALARLAAVGGGPLAALNFASAKNPGGGFLGGAEAQEESLARSSGLYPCLLAAPAYYERHRAGGSGLYLDLAIWSPAVPFIRDDAGALLEELFCASVITSPAPNAGSIEVNEPENRSLIEPTLRRRAAFILALAQKRGVRRLVLGAWGCGVFRNDPALVAGVFAELLRAGRFSDAFEEVVFAILDRSPGQNVLGAFQKALA